MEVWLSHPMEIAFDLWTLVFSLLICLFMIHQRKVLMRNNILFFVWFMLNAVFLVLKLEAYRNDSLMSILGVVGAIYLIVSVLIFFALAVSIHHGVKKAFNLEMQEWLYIIVNGIGILFFLITGTSILERFLAGQVETKTLLVSLVGFMPALFALGVDLTYLREYHERLRRSSPHMMYVFMIAFVAAALFFSVFKGSGYSAGVLTVAMMCGFFFYCMSLRRRRVAEPKEVVLVEKEEEVPITLTEFSTTAELESLPELVSSPYIPETPALVPQRKPAANGAVSLLDLNPHFLFNTLNASYYLVEQNPEQAKDSIVQLSSYIKGKADAVKIDHLIPIESELELTKAYLSIMEMRYDDLFHVNYDLETTGFLVPPLTLLSLCEFALDKEIKRNHENGEVRIFSSKDSLCNRLSVSYAIDPEAHVDKEELLQSSPELAAVKQRLENYCRGAMEILPESDRVVLVAYLPLKSQDFEEVKEPSAAGTA